MKFDLNIEKAKIENLDDISRLVLDLSHWLKSKGINQWTNGIPRNILEQELSRGELFVILANQEFIGSVALTKNSDDLWSDKPGKATYLHRIAIRRNQSGKGIGQYVIKWAETEVMQHGGKILRLVCDVNNPFLSNYYLNLGYKSCGNKEYKPWNMTFARFEKKVR